MSLSKGQKIGLLLVIILIFLGITVGGLIATGVITTGTPVATKPNAGGSTAGGSTAGGSTTGGSTAGGSTAGGSTTGGSTAGGSTAGGSTTGGSTAGGSTTGGSTAGGSTTGGSTVTSPPVPAIPERKYKPDVSTVEFGGIFAIIDNNNINNPATGAMTCPDGFSEKKIKHAANLDYPVTFCYKEIDDPDTWTPSDGSLDFGGMYGARVDNGVEVNNPFTKGKSCPTGFKDLTISGGALVPEKPLHLCYKKIMDVDNWNPSAGSLQFGGMYGFVNGTKVINPVTSSMGCPRGFGDFAALHTANIDWPVSYCAKSW
jgi:hypothetical protein